MIYIKKTPKTKYIKEFEDGGIRCFGILNLYVASCFYGAKRPHPHVKGGTMTLCGSYIRAYKKLHGSYKGFKMHYEARKIFDKYVADLKT